MDTRQIRENITEIEANRLLELYDYYSKNFNPGTVRRNHQCTTEVRRTYD